MEHRKEERWRHAGWPGGVPPPNGRVWQFGGEDAAEPAGEDASAPASSPKTVMLAI